MGLGKIIFKFGFVCFLITISSCKKYPEDESLGFKRAKKRLIGSWIIKTVDGESLSSVSSHETLFVDSCGNDYPYHVRSIGFVQVDFNEDKTLTAFSSTTRISVDYFPSYSGCDTIMKHDISTSTGEGEWKFRYLKNILVLGDLEHRILKLTEDEMKLLGYKSNQVILFEKSN
jgi:hypothetical protein